MAELNTTLKALMNEVSITVTELARQTGVGQPVIHRMASGETDNPKVGSLSPIAKFFNVTISELIGDDPLSDERLAGSYNPYYRSWSKLPLLSWEQAAALPKRLASEIVSYISTEANVSDNAFAVKMEDHTMAPQFPNGTMMVIEPNLKPQDNDFAAVLVDGDEKIQVKQILFDGKDLYLKSLNNDFDTKRVGTGYKIIGVVLQALVEFHTDRLPKRVVGEQVEASPVKKRRNRTEESV